MSKSIHKIGKSQINHFSACPIFAGAVITLDSYTMKNNEHKLDIEVTRLNRLFGLYLESTRENRIKPYRVSRLKSYLEETTRSLNGHYELIELTPENFTDVFPQFEKALSDIRMDKLIQLKKGDYEMVSVVRQRENEIIKLCLSKLNIPIDNYFFHYQNKIFKNLKPMERTLDLDNLVKCWKAFAADPKLLANYDSPNWTSFIVGEKTSSNADSPFGDYFIKYFGSRFAYRKEDGLVDLSIYQRDQYVKDIFKIGKKNAGEKRSLKDYPKEYDVLFEHENDPSKSCEEMCKLSYFRANLKVLVTYIWDSDNAEDGAKTHQQLSENFETIIKQSNSSYPENVETSYLLITGQRVSGSLLWRFTGFSVMNTLKQVDPYVMVFRYSKTNPFNN